MGSHQAGKQAGWSAASSGGQGRWARSHPEESSSGKSVRWAVWGWLSLGPFCKSSGGLVGPHPAAFVDVERPVMRLRRRQGVRVAGCNVPTASPTPPGLPFPRSSSGLNAGLPRGCGLTCKVSLPCNPGLSLPVSRIAGLKPQVRLESASWLTNLSLSPCLLREHPSLTTAPVFIALSALQNCTDLCCVL